MKLGKLLVILGVFICFGAVNAPVQQAKAVEKSPLRLFWWPEHWQPPVFEPYLRDSKLYHDTQWNDGDWHPQEWIDEKGSIEAVVEGFYEARIITRQYVDGEMPVLEVGRRFLELSDQEKRRIASFIDYGFGVTKNAETGSFEIKMIKKDNPLGIYTKEGLQLQ